MSRLSTAPLVSDSVAVLSAHAFKQLVSQDNALFASKLTRPLGLAKLLDASLIHKGGFDTTVQDLFRNGVNEANEFSAGMGLYIADDIKRAFRTDSVIGKISVVSKDEQSAGVVVFVIPEHGEHNAVMVTSGGVQNPAFSNGVGVSVLTRAMAFSALGETLSSITHIVTNNAESGDETNWEEADHVSFSVYDAEGDHVSLNSQTVLVFEDNTYLVKQANAAKGYIASTDWQDRVFETSPIEGFVFAAQEAMAHVLNSKKSKASALNLAVVGSDDATVEPVEKHKEFEFVPVFFGRRKDIQEDPFGSDSHRPYVEPQQDASHVEGEIETTPVEDSSTDLAEVATAIPAAAVDDASGALPATLDYADVAEEVVTHSELSEVTNEQELEHNDSTASTEQPFDLGAEYLIENVSGDLPVVPEVSLMDVAAPEEPVYQPVSAAAVAASYADEALSWDDLDANNEQGAETASQGTLDDIDDIDDLDNISWEETVQTIADADSNDNESAPKAPLRGFLIAGESDNPII